MRRVGSNSAVPTKALRRAGFSYRGLVIAIGLLLCVAALAWAALPRLIGSGADGDGPEPHVVTRGEFIHDATERGNIESASNVEVVSKVESLSGGGMSGGTAILFIVDEGYVITEDDISFDEDGNPTGKILVELDSASLENEELQQNIIVENSRAAKIQAEAAVETAKIDLQEYLKGTYEQERRQIEILIDEAKEELSRLKDYLAYSERLNAKGYVSDLELEGDRAAVTKAENKLALAKLDLTTLNAFTKNKMVTQLEAEIETAEAKLEAAISSLLLDQGQHDRIKEQIENCTIRATQPGQVVYANREGYRGSGEVVIEEGTVIRERQAIFRLPDPTQMQVKAKISEGKISMIKVGMPTTVRLDAFPDNELQGTVTDVSEYPASSGWMGSAIKHYETLIKINNPPPDLRPGYTAEVRIRIERLDDVIHVPVQSIIEHGGKLYAAFHEKGAFRAQEVKIGSTNDKRVVITSGLSEGDRIVLDANTHRDKLDLPELEPKKNGKRNGRGPRGPVASETGGARPNKAAAAEPRVKGQGTGGMPSGGRP